MEDAGDKHGFDVLRGKKLFPFQADGVAKAFFSEGVTLSDGIMFLWDAGVGKSIGGTALAGVMIESKEADLVLLVCEQNKIKEWVRDLRENTTLDVRMHYGSTRWKKMESEGLPQVLVTTYDTVRLDAVVKSKTRTLRPGRLLSLIKGRDTLVIYDEIAGKLRNRTSGNYKAHEYVLKELRKNGGVKVLGLTATPIERSYEDGFNQLRLVAPTWMPPIKDWESACIRYRDRYGRPVYDQMQVRMFAESVEPLLHRKRKSDPDVIDQFPPMMEEYRFVELHPKHKALYETLEEIAFEELEVSQAAAWMTIRQAIGHPAALLYPAFSESGSPLAKAVVETLGADHLRSLPCNKMDEVLTYLDTVVNAQQDKAVLFTYFGGSVLQVIAEKLGLARIPYFLYHGGRSHSANELAKEDFKRAKGGAVLLCSDAAARGINLREATYVVHYESPLTHGMYLQRRDRIHRIDSCNGPVTSMTFITEGTIEENIAQTVLRRNETHDLFVGDVEGSVSEEFVSAADRRLIMELARERYEARKKGRRS